MKTVTPDEMRGRLEGISLSVVGTGPSLGNAEAGLLALILPRYRRYDAAGSAP